MSALGGPRFSTSWHDVAKVTAMAYPSKLLWLWVEPVSSLREKPVWNQEQFTIVFGAGQIDGRAGTQALEGE